MENLYTPDMLRGAFAELRILHLEEREEDLHEGAGHSGLSAVIGMVAVKA